MIVCLTEQGDTRSSDFYGPPSWHVSIASEKNITETSDFSYDFRVQNVLSSGEVLVMRDNAQTGFPQLCRKVIGPEVSICEKDRIRRRNM